MKTLTKRRALLSFISLLLICYPEIDTNVCAFVLTSTSPIPSRYRHLEAFTLRQAKQEAVDITVKKNATSKLPILKVQNRLEEIQIRNLEGEKLTQDYCDSVLGLCVAAEEWSCVLEVLDVMKDQGLEQQYSTYRSCLQSCFEMSNGAAAQEILDAMEKALVKPSPEDLGLVAATMCRNNKQKSGWWKNALELLMDNPSPDISVDAYQAVFTCMVDERKWKESLRLLREMEGVNDKRLHPEPNLSIYREVIECCVAANKVDQAFQLILSLMDRKVTPTVYTFELVISALSKKLQLRRAIQLLDLMGESGVTKTVLTYNTIITACSRAKEVGMAKNLLVRMKKEGIKPSIVTYNSLLSACASSDRWKDAMNVLDQLNRDPYCTADIYTYTNAIRACAKAGKIDRALNMYEVVKHKKIPLDSYFYAAIIEACAKVKQWKRALKLLDEMKQEGIAPTVVIYGVTINACGYGKQWKKSLDLLDEMRDQGLQVGLITYNSAINSLARAAKYPSGQTHSLDIPDENEELWIRSLQLLDQMKKDGIRPDGFSFASAIRCCGENGRWKEAVNLLEIMRDAGPKTQPNKIAYTSAITACGRAGEYKTALGLFRQMKNEGLNPDRIAYNAVFNSLKRSNQSDLAYDLWKEMCGTNDNAAATKGTATAEKWTKPDIITLTDLIATLSDEAKIDEVFADGVDRGIVFSKMLDSTYEVDLSGMSFPVARAACRYALRRMAQTVKNVEQIKDLRFITGVGVATNRKNSKGNSMHLSGKQNSMDFVADYSSGGKKTMSLRDYIQTILREDFDPPIESVVPQLTQGTVEVDKSLLQLWIKQQRNLNLK